MNGPSRRCRSEKMTSDWLRNTNHLRALQVVRVTMTGCLETAAHQNLASALIQSVCLSVCLSLSVRLPALQRCDEEEEQLQLKRRQIRVAELSLSELQQVRHGTQTHFLQCSFLPIIVTVFDRVFFICKWSNRKKTSIHQQYTNKRCQINLSHKEKPKACLCFSSLQMIDLIAF